MKSVRVLLIAAVAVALGGVAYFAEEQKSTGTRMTEAAQKLLESLSAEQKQKATFAFDDKERVNWIYVPVQDKEKRPGRKGLRLEEMNEEQKKAVLELLRSGTSESGFSQAVTIMSLESVLRDLEMNGAMVRNPGWYFVTIFGTPAKTGNWGWRIEGHHLSLNFTVKDGQVASATPAFFGANPAEIKSGDKKGQRTLGDVEEAAKTLVESLNAEQLKLAGQAKHFGEFKQHESEEKPGPAVGLPASKMTAAQKDLLAKLLKAYTNRMPATIAAAQWKSVDEGGLDNVYFAWTGKSVAGQAHTYRVQGPTFLVQLLNVQDDSAKNPANHIHSAWRELPSDFALTAK